MGLSHEHATGCSRVIEGTSRFYQTAGGFTMIHPEKVPANAEPSEWEDYRFEAVDMDGPGLKKLLITIIDADKQEIPFKTIKKP